jgi:hypothetical protein
MLAIYLLVLHAATAPPPFCLWRWSWFEQTVASKFWYMTAIFNSFSLLIWTLVSLISKLKRNTKWSITLTHRQENTATNTTLQNGQVAGAYPLPGRVCPYQLETKVSWILKLFTMLYQLLSIVWRYCDEVNVNDKLDWIHEDVSWPIPTTTEYV